MTNQAGANVGGKLHGVCLSVYCTLMLTSLMVSHTHARLAQMGGGLSVSERVQSGALQALSGAAKEGFSGTQNAVLPAPVTAARPVSVDAQQAISLSQLAAAVRSKGLNAPMSAKGAATLGLSNAGIPCKAVETTVSREKHSVSVCSVEGKDYFVFTRQSGSDLWAFMLDDSQALRKAFHGGVGAGFHEISSSEGAPLASAEKGFWLQWAADGGNIVSSNS